MSEIHFSKKGERSVTPFVGQELLYDYVRGDLDPERVQALEKLLADNRDLKIELEKIRDGLRYVLDLQKTQVSAALTENIRTPSTYFHVLLQKMKFRDWPDGIKLAAEGFVIGIGALTMILLIPWGKILSWKTELERTSITLTEVARTKNADPDSETAPVAEKESNQGIVYEDEGKQPAESKPAASVPVVAAAEKNAKASAKPVAAPTPAPAVHVQSETVMAATAPDSGKKQGILYRGSIQVTNLDAVTPKLVEYIASIGGRKAGEVELGWKKGGGSYFHFTIPEAKYKPLIDLFNEYGKLKISKEPHPRVMPDGIIRLIITVDEKK
jgi:hypothetical protein